MEISMSKFAFGAVLVVLIMQNYAYAQTVHVVGDSSNWTVPRTSASLYQDWASSKKFVVGDILTFNFATNEHDVLRVPKASYDGCTSANPIGQMITTGPANVTLDSAGDHFYICTIGRHCLGGQKLSITVSAAPGASPPSSNTPRPPPPATTTPPTAPSPTSPADCAPAPASPPTSGGPAPQGTSVPPPPPTSSSSAVVAGVYLSFFSIVMAFFF
ncbi:hypothetical protein FNV43_RR06976 [Rhamnella rubrinervis]|uniref:Phytocyanin domain-containing protein n=1 Tax=Rhamnella rubrinervis TaxID=2594499 RepID=A0A8K0HDX1_9ROSA|nr:hypothetical protein FNV43_RR06976 [Rhamnella rubrinervis]